MVEKMITERKAPHLNMLACILILLGIVIVSGKDRLSESERVAQWHERGNTWPPNWSETETDTEQFKNNMAVSKHHFFLILNPFPKT